MPMNRFHAGCLAAFLACAVSSPVLRAEETPAPPPAAPAVDENARITALIAHIEGMQGVKFIRNGSEYDAATAAKFLRGKWDRAKDKIKTARDFIDQAATKSSTSGQAYTIRKADGTVVPCRDELLKTLETMEKKTP